MTFSLKIKRTWCSSLLSRRIISIIAYVMGNICFAGKFLRRTASFDGSWELCKYGTDAYGEVKV